MSADAEPSKLDSARHPFQVMPPLAPDEYDALVADIRANGVLVPVLVDQQGRIIDGHHRHRAAAEAGVECPTVTRRVGSDEEARQLALSLNAARRHLSREQQADLIIIELRTRPHDPDRAIARRLACSPSTVGKYRAVLAEHEEQRRRQEEADRQRRAQEAAREKAERDRAETEFSRDGLIMDAERLHRGLWRRRHWQTGDLILWPGPALTWPEAADQIRSDYSDVADDWIPHLVGEGMTEDEARHSADRIVAEQFAPMFDEICAEFRDRKCGSSCPVCNGGAP